MDADDMKRYISDTFDGVLVLESTGDSFFIYDPAGDLPGERQFPFATIVTGDNHDRVSELHRPEAYRLNIGLTKATYSSWFGPAPSVRDEDGVLQTEFDYSALDQLMPHPIYGSQHWVCVITPSEATFEAIRPLLAEAHEFAARKHTNQQARRPTP